MQAYSDPSRESDPHALPDVEVSAMYVFNYPWEFVTLPEYSARRGQCVTVVRQLTPDEADQGDGMERMFQIRAADGWIGEAWESEPHGPFATEAEARADAQQQSEG